MINFLLDFFLGFWALEVVVYPMVALTICALFHIAFKFLGR